jgi:hypothetical protein
MTRPEFSYLPKKLTKPINVVVVTVFDFIAGCGYPR